MPDGDTFQFYKSFLKLMSVNSEFSVLKSQLITCSDGLSHSLMPHNPQWPKINM